jgi:hypothetical protein
VKIADVIEALSEHDPDAVLVVDDGPGSLGWGHIGLVEEPEHAEGWFLEDGMTPAVVLVASQGRREVLRWMPPTTPELEPEPEAPAGPVAIIEDDEARRLIDWATSEGFLQTPVWLDDLVARMDLRLRDAGR